MKSRLEDYYAILCDVTLLSNFCVCYSFPLQYTSLQKLLAFADPLVTYTNDLEDDDCSLVSVDTVSVRICSLKASLCLSSQD